jgi:hypothetical protein
VLAVQTTSTRYTSPVWSLCRFAGVASVRTEEPDELQAPNATLLDADTTLVAVAWSMVQNGLTLH